MPKFEKLDLSLAREHFHPDLNTRDYFLCKIQGNWHLGKFNKQWYGFNFLGWFNWPIGLQFDAPGDARGNRWQEIYKMVLE